jgi:predicted ATPase/DNA-binding CsgD family transcriptional regulator
MERRDMLDGMTAYASSAILIGREPDLAALRDALKRIRSAEPAAVLLGGEAGVGKTRLMEEFGRSVAGTARVLTGQCLELGEEGLPYAPFAAALRELVRVDGPAVLEGREHEFARLLPELGPDTVGDARRGQLFDLVAGLFGRISAERPLVLVLEDLHWADRSTRDLIGFLLRSARLPHLLLVATYRTDELHRGHPLRPFLAELDRVRGVQRLELDRLDRDGTAEMLTQLLGTEPEPHTVDHIAERTQGNPFFIEQFAAIDDPSCCDIPDGLRDLLLARVDALPEAAQRVLRVAAVGGTQFGHDLLTRVTGGDEAALESALRVAVAAQLLLVDPDGGYEFRHALVREAVHDDLLPGEHARLHARYAEAIEADPHLVPMGGAPADIAHHWHAAHEIPKALVAAKRAADAAGRRYAYAEQARLLDRVLELWEQVPDAAGLLGGSHLDLLEEAAGVAIDAGENKRAMKLTRAALADLDHAAEPLRAARLLVRRSKLLRNAGSSDGAAEAREAYQLLRTAPNSAERVLVLAAVAHGLADVDDEQTTLIAQEALTAAAELGDVVSEVSAAVTFNRVCSGVVPAQEGLKAVREAVDRARAAGDLPNLAEGLVQLSDALFEVAAYEESATAAAEGIPYADRIGVSRTTGAFLLANSAEALIALGRWDEADARLAEAARHDPPGTLAVSWLRLRAQLRLARGLDGAERLLDRALAFLGKPFLNYDNRLCLLDLRIVAALQRGDTAETLAAVRGVVDEPLIDRRPRYGWILLADAATALSRAGSGPGPAADDLDALGERIAERAAALPRRYPADRAHAAQVAATLDGGAELWRAAVAEWRLDGQCYALATALVALAAAEAGSGNRAGASDAIGEAAAIAAALGAGPLLAEAETLARRVGVRGIAGRGAAGRGAAGRGAAGRGAAGREAAGRGAAELGAAAGRGAAGQGTAGQGTAGLWADGFGTPGRGAGPARGGSVGMIAGAEVLTAREREVLRLVAEGMSNGQIAQRLYISPKTASVHVSRIIAKLEVSNRVEAAAVAHRLGLLDVDQV